MRTRIQRRETRTGALRGRRRAQKNRARSFLLVLLAAVFWTGAAMAAPARSDVPGPEQLSALKQIHLAFGAAYDSGERFVAGEKNSVELCNFAEKARSEEWNYVYGAKGQRMTAGLISSIISSNVGDASSPYTSITYIADTMRQSGNRATDCSGLVMDFMWWAGDMSDPVRALCPSIGAYNANAMLDAAQERGTIATMPEIPGLLVHRNGHVGVYIGNGEVIEARGVKYGVTKTLMSEHGWTYWSKSPWIDYDVTGIYEAAGRMVFLDGGEDIGEERWIAKFVYGDDTAGSTYTPWFDPAATFIHAAQAVPDVEPGAGEGYAPDGSIQPLEKLPLAYQIVAMIHSLPYDAQRGYFYQSHWYQLVQGADGTWQAVLNDPPPHEETGGLSDQTGDAPAQIAVQPDSESYVYQDVPPPVPDPVPEVTEPDQVPQAAAPSAKEETTAVEAAPAAAEGAAA